MAIFGKLFGSLSGSEMSEEEALEMRRLRATLIAGADPESAVRTAQNLQNLGFAFTIRCLSEPPQSVEDARHSSARTIEVIEWLIRDGLDLSVTADLVHLGGLIKDVNMDDHGDFLGKQLLKKHASANGQDSGLTMLETLKSLLTLEVEGPELVDQALALRERLSLLGLNVACTIQSCLERSVRDTMTLISQRAPIRLTEGVTLGHEGDPSAPLSEIRQRYLELVDLMLSEDAVLNRIYPIFVVRDVALADQVIKRLRSQRWADPYEFEGAMGHNEQLYQSLLQNGHPIRMVVPYGEHWHDYVKGLDKA